MSLSLMDGHLRYLHLNFVIIVVNNLLFPCMLGPLTSLTFQEVEQLRTALEKEVFKIEVLHTILLD